MKKVISLVLAFILTVSVMSTGFCAYAAEDAVTVIISGTQNNETVKQALDSLNNTRETNGADALDFDKDLMRVARQCAIKSMLHADAEYSLPDGSAITTLLPEYGATCTVAVGTISEPSVQDITDALDGYKSLPTISAIGAAAFTSGDTTVLYAIVSTVQAGEVETNFNTEMVTVREKVLVSNLYNGKIEFENAGNGKYILSMSVTGTGFSYDYFKVADSDVVYRSSNSKVFKIVGKNAYVKNNGTVKISSYTPAGSLLIQSSLPCTRSSAKPSITSVKSNSKKTLTLKWTKNITNANGYQIQYSTNKKFKNAKTVTIKGKNKTSKTIKKLKSGKKYYVRVRAYANQGEGEKLFTPWSAKKAVKVKSATKNTVYITPTGIRYHYDPDCAGKNAIKTTIKDAKSAGYTPCKTCVHN